MSAELVRKSLAIVDPDLDIQNSGSKRRKRVKNVTDLMPDNYKVIRKINRNGQKEKINLLSTSTKLTVLEARKKYKPKEVILKENLEKLEIIRKVCTVDLDEEVTTQLIERAVTRRPVKSKGKTKKEEKTAFTEDDFKKFEEEYFDE